MRIKNPKQPEELGKQGDINKPNEVEDFEEMKEVTDHFISDNDALFLNVGDIESKNFINKRKGFKFKENGELISNSAKVYKGRVGANLVAIDPGDDVQGAVNAVDKLGGGTVYFSPGIYNLTSDLILPSNVILEGQSPQNTIISFGLNNAQIKVHGSNLYETGTVSITHGTQTVTGSGTAWSSNVSVGQYIRLGDDNWFQITAVNSDTELTIYNLFFGDDQSGANYKIASIKENVSINHIAVIKSAIDGISFYLTNNMKIFNIFSMYNGGHGIKADVSDWNILRYIISAYNTTNGLHLNDAKNNMSNKFFLIGNGGVGLYADNMKYSEFYSTRCEHNTSYGIQVTNSFGIGFTRFNCANNSSRGIFINSNNFITVSGSAENNGSVGVSVLDTDNSIVEECLVQTNNSEGIKFESCNNNIFSNNVLKNNSQAGSGSYDEVLITDDGVNYSTYNIISSNNINTTNGNYGIKENASGDDYNNIHGNIVQGAVTANIFTQGVNTIVNDNIS